MRREGVDAAARPLRSEYVTGNYFTTLGVGAFGGRVFTEADDKPSAPPVVVISHHVWQGTYGGDPSMVGATVMVNGHPFTVAGVAPPGFFGETLRGDPPDLWIPLQQEPLIAGDSALLRQPVSAWLRVIGRLRPGASTDGMAPRLTGVLRQWMQHDSGYPANWMPDVIRMLPKQTIAVVPAGAGVGVMKEEYGQSLQILLVVCALVLLIACANVANLLLARAVARRTQTPCGWRSARRAGRSSRRRWSKACSRSPAAPPASLVAMGASDCCLTGVLERQGLPISNTLSPLSLVFAFGLTASSARLRRGAGVAGDAHRSGRGAARIGTLDERSFVVRAHRAARSCRPRCRSSSSRERRCWQEFEQAGEPKKTSGCSRSADGGSWSLNRPPATYTVPKLAALYRELEDRLNRLPGEESGLAFYQPPHRQLGRASCWLVWPSCAEAR